MKYLKPIFALGSYGLSHQRSNLFALIKYCYHYQYGLILPKWNLTGRHNNQKNRTTDLTEYYNFDDLKVNGKPYQIYLENNIDLNKVLEKIKFTNIKGGLLRTSDQLDKLKQINLQIDLDYHQTIIKQALPIINRLKTNNNMQNYTCVHVRRTDRLTNQEIAKATSAPNISDKIKQTANSVVYLMTDEPNLSLFSSLKNFDHYQVKFYTDFPELIEAKKTDNYLLFCIENVICQYANIRISTFKTTNPYYHDFLSNASGFQ